MVYVRFLPSGDGLEVATGERLLDALDDRELVILPTACRGATCGMCRVHVTRGAALLAPASEEERLTLSTLGAAADERLGCQLVCQGAGEVDLSR